MPAFINALAIQVLDNAQTQLVMERIEIMFILILTSIVIFILMTTPIVLFFNAFDNYFKWKLLKKQITNELCCSNNSHPTYVSEVCDQYKKSFAKFISNLLGLVSWNVLSLIYISVVFSSFKTGISSYFSLPFKVIESYTLNYSTNALFQFKTQAIYMFAIFVMSLLFLEAGNYIACFLLKNNLMFNLKDKIFKRLKFYQPKAELND